MSGGKVGRADEIHAVWMIYFDVGLWFESNTETVIVRSIYQGWIGEEYVLLKNPDIDEGRIRDEDGINEKLYNKVMGMLKVMNEHFANQKTVEAAFYNRKWENALILMSYAPFLSEWEIREICEQLMKSCRRLPGEKINQTISYVKFTANVGEFLQINQWPKILNVCRRSTNIMNKNKSFDFVIEFYMKKMQEKFLNGLIREEILKSRNQKQWDGTVDKLCSHYKKEATICVGRR
jgi:hypothetical protein